MKQDLLDKDFQQNICTPDVKPQGIIQEPDLWVSRLGRFQGYGTFRMNYFTEYLFCYIIYEGETELIIDGQHWTMRKGDICFFFPGQHKILKENHKAPLVNIYLDLSGSRAIEILRQMEIKPGQQCFRGKFDDVCEPLFKDLEAAFAKDTHPVHYPTIAAWRFIDLISQSLHTNTQYSASPAEIARQLIRQNFHNHLSIEEIARKLNISRATLFRQFKARYQLSPKQYLDELRLRQARLFLEKTDSTIGEISFSCGYDSPQHFTRMFKRHNGKSPSKFRIK